MKKAIKIIVRTISGLIIFLITLPILINLLLQIDGIQNFAVHKTTEFLSQRAGTQISISSVKLNFFTSAHLTDIYIGDFRGDTMIYAKELAVDIRGINFLTGKISLGEINLINGTVNLYKDSTGVLNANAVFKKLIPPKENPTPVKLALTASELKLYDIKFTYKEYGHKESKTLNPKDLEFFISTFDSKHITVVNDDINFAINNIVISEKCGLAIEHLSTPIGRIDSRGLRFADVEVVSEKTHLMLDSLKFVGAGKRWQDWKNFEDMMVIRARIRDSKLSTTTLSYLAELNIEEPFEIDIQKARIAGTTVFLNCKATNISMLGNTLNGNFKIKGLPDINNTVFTFNVQSLQSSYGSINQLSKAFSKEHKELADYNIIRNLGNIDLSLQLEGKINNFKGKLNINSSTAGDIKATCSMQKNRAGERIFAGAINTTNYNLGRALGQQNVGNTTFSGNYSLDINAQSSLVFNADFHIDSLRYNTYTYHSIDLNGTFNEGKFNGLIAADDPNLNIDIDGAFDYSSSTPRYKVDAELHQVNLAAINLNKRDSISVLSAKFNADGSGSTLDDFNGGGIIHSILYINHTDTVRTSSININSIAEPDYKEINVKSKFLEATLRGRKSFDQIFGYLSNSITRFLPSFQEVSTIVDKNLAIGTAPEKIVIETPDSTFSTKDAYYQLQLKVKEANNVASAFIPTLNIAQGSSINFIFNPYIDQVNLKAKSEYITSDNFLIKDLQIDSHNISDSLSIFTTAENFAIGNNFFPNLSVIGGIHDNIISLGAQYKSNNKQNSALINTTTHLALLENGTPQIQIDIHPTAVVLNSKQWNLSPAKIILDSTQIAVKNLKIYNNQQHLAVNGRVGRKDSDTLIVSLQKANISPLDYFVESIGYNVEGYAQGDIRLINILNEPKMFASVGVSDINVSGNAIDDIMIRSVIDNEEKQIKFSVTSTTSNTTPPILGNYSFANKTFTTNIELPNIPLAFLDPMLKGVISNSQGEADAKLTLTAKETDISLDGTITFDKFATTIDYTKARYTLLDGNMEVKNSCFYLSKTKFNDSSTGSGEIWVDLTSNSFKNLSYDIKMDFEDLLALNTTAADNSSFFGKAWATGRMEVAGSENKTTMNVIAQTAQNSIITMPLMGASNIAEAEFIRFKRPQRDSVTQINIVRDYRKNNRTQRERESSMEIDMNFDINVLSNTLAQIELDPKVGDIIKGRGEGRINMHINPTLDIFDMNGTVRLVEGDYLFTLQTIINKKFIIDPGGTLEWTGDATNPNVQLMAIYKLKTSISPLTGDVSSNAKTNIDCGIALTERLLTPRIEFSITAPSADAETQNALQNSLNTDEELSMQFLSLMLANSFMPDTGTAAIGSMGSNMAEVTGIEFLSNQLSNLISSDKLDIRIGYSPMSETSSDEFSAGVGTDLIDNVLSLEVDGNYSTQNNSAVISDNPFSVDAYLTWNINQSGTLKLKGFTRTIDRFDETQGMQESGVGVYFTQDFNNFNDLKERLRKSFSASLERVEKRKERKEERKKNQQEKKQQKQERKNLEYENLTFIDDENTRANPEDCN